jgi:monomeric sarcosine oxidase
MRVVIVGAGGVGTMAAWRLARTGNEVIALEQFQLDHDQGSSYGDSRIIRRVYSDPFYTRMMADSYRLWGELISEAQDSGLFVQTGGVLWGPADDPRLQSAENALASSGVPYELLDATEAARRFPAVRLQSHEVAVYEPGMGFARASRSVRAAAGLARSQGVLIRENSRVVAVDSAHGGVRVTLNSCERVTAERLIVAAGAWTKPLLQSLGLNLPLAVTRQPYVHLNPARRAADFEPGRFPVWIDIAANAYGFPRLGDLPGVKLGIHDVGETVTPEAVIRTVQEADREAARRYAASRFPDLGPDVVYEKVCLYTNTPDEDFIVDTVPGLPSVLVLSPCSGHGFKFAPLIGQIAADWARDLSIPYDLSRFRLARFA